MTMKISALSWCLLFLAATSWAQVTPVPATQAEVNAGVNKNKYVTPATLAGVAGAPNMVGFEGLNGIQNPASVNMLQRFEQQMGTNMAALCDGVILDPAFMFATNMTTIKGRTFVSSNLFVTLNDPWGVAFSNSLLRVDNLPIGSVWSLAVEYDTPPVIVPLLPVNTELFLGGLLNTNTLDSYYISGGMGQWPQQWGRKGATGWWGDGFTNMVQPITDWYGNYSAIEHNVNRNRERHVDIISVSNNIVMQPFMDGLPGLFNYNSGGSPTGPIVISTNVGSLGSLLLGWDAVPSFSSSGVFGNNPFQGRIKAALLFTNIVMTTNLAITVQQAFQCLEPDTTIRIYISDSRGEANGLFAADETNLFNWWAQQNFPTEHSWFNYAIGGTAEQDFNTHTNIAYWIPPPPGVKLEIEDELGVNDWGNNGSTLAQIEGYTATSIAITKSFNANFRKVIPWSVATNCSLPGFLLWYSNVTAYAQWVVTNYSPSISIVRGDLAIDTESMNTNRGFSLPNGSGLHLSTAFPMNKLVGQIWTFGPTPSFVNAVGNKYSAGELDGDGSITNWQPWTWYAPAARSFLRKSNNWEFIVSQTVTNPVAKINP